jgi:hypothetical protein
LTASYEVTVPGTEAIALPFCSITYRVRERGGAGLAHAIVTEAVVNALTVRATGRATGAGGGKMVKAAAILTIITSATAIAHVRPPEAEGDDLGGGGWADGLAR